MKINKNSHLIQMTNGSVLYNREKVYLMYEFFLNYSDDTLRKRDKLNS